MSLGVGSARAAPAASVVAREGEGGVEDAARAATVSRARLAPNLSSMMIM